MLSRCYFQLTHNSIFIHVDVSTTVLRLSSIQIFIYYSLKTKEKGVSYVIK
ncbi:Uncharacterised protein [Staphylococcus chromogenes]|nr:Uncharacterised protein [Staphylococcus chromogenes]